LSQRATGHYHQAMMAEAQPDRETPDCVTARLL
jgi:hypothetical protein